VLFRSAEALYKTIHEVPTPFVRTLHESTVAAASALLGEEVFRAAWAEGQMMTLEQVLGAQKPVTVSTTVMGELSSVPHASQTSPSPDRLTIREVQVLRLVAQGLTNEQVAQQLIISPRTVNTHLTSIFSKIGVPTRSAATRYALDHHLV